jgi:glutamine amidotransferase
MIAIVDYGLGNLKSVENALNFLGIKCVITRKKGELENADKIILPGVGAFKEAMENLKKFGLIEILNNQVLDRKKPFLGICLGMQLICKKSYEGGEFEGLGWVDAEVIKFENNVLRVPHVGWNDVSCEVSCPILFNGNEKQTFYFVHSYYVNPESPEIIKGNCSYGVDFCAILQKGNIFATQFHPEKSQKEGLEILRKFSEL